MEVIVARRRKDFSPALGDGRWCSDWNGRYNTSKMPRYYTLRNEVLWVHDTVQHKGRRVRQSTIQFSTV